MKTLVMSDTHNQHQRLTPLSPADIIVHSGDISMAGTSKKLLSHGSELEVLEPKWFRDEIAEIISELHNTYQNQAKM